MTQYIVEISHNAATCTSALEEFDRDARDKLGEIYWNCLSGNHVGRVLVDGKSEEEVREKLPSSVRDHATITESRLVSPDLLNAIDPEAKPH